MPNSLEELRRLREQMDQHYAAQLQASMNAELELATQNAMQAQYSRGDQRVYFNQQATYEYHQQQQGYFNQNILYDAQHQQLNTPPWDFRYSPGSSSIFTPDSPHPTGGTSFRSDEFIYANKSIKGFTKNKKYRVFTTAGPHMYAYGDDGVLYQIEEKGFRKHKRNLPDWF